MGDLRVEMARKRACPPIGRHLNEPCLQPCLGRNRQPEARGKLAPTLPGPPPNRLVDQGPGASLSHPVHADQTSIIGSVPPFRKRLNAA
jgi:hypothetical protein